MTDSTNTEATQGEASAPTARRRRPRRAVSPVTAPAPVETTDATPVADAAAPVEAPAEAPGAADVAPAAAAPETAAAPEAPVAEDATEPTAPAKARRTTTRKPRKTAAEKRAEAAAAEAAAAEAAAPAEETAAAEPAAVADEPAAPAVEEPAAPAVETPAGEPAADETAAPAEAPAAEPAADAPAAPKRPRRRRATSSVTTPEPRADADQKLDVLAALGVKTPDPVPLAEAQPGDVVAEAAPEEAEDEVADDSAAEAAEDAAAEEEPRLPAAALLFQAPDLSRARPRRRAQAPAGPPAPVVEEDAEEEETSDEQEETTTEAPAADESSSAGRRRRRRGGRGRRRSSTSSDADDSEDTEEAPQAAPEAVAEPAATTVSPDGSADTDDDSDDDDASGSSSRRRRRRRRTRTTSDDGAQAARDEVTALQGSTRLEAKRQRRREGREAGRRRREIITEAEFLARRESVDRRMIVREKDGLNQIAVVEDGVLVEHYVARHTQTSMVGNVYLGRVQNVLPSMEAAFIDIGKGRNAVLYAGEVNWEAAGLEGQPRRIEQALKSGDTVLVQVTKDPIGHKGARLTSQVTLAGRYLVLVPSGAMTGISRKLPDTERARLKKLLKKIVPEGSGVIVRTAAEGASEEQLTEDVQRLTKMWADIEAKSKNTKNAPVLLKGEPELAVRVVRDVFNEDFRELVVSGEQAWSTISTYVQDLSPDLVDRMVRWTEDGDVFASYRIDEQLAKGMDRKVWLPSGGSLVIDRTEAMTVIDVNTGKFTGSGGTLEETVTRNNLEAAEEIVRQLRLRDIGGIIVIDFIDMVLESNRELVMRRLVECLGRDRTRHQVAEVTSLGLVQMTRKRVGQGLVEAFSTPCEHCNGRGFIVHDHPVEKDAQAAAAEDEPAGRRNRRGRGSTAPAKSAPVIEVPAPVASVEEAPNRAEIKAKLAAIAAAAASAHEHPEGEHGEADAPAEQPAGGEPQPEARTEEPAVQPDESGNGLDEATEAPADLTLEVVAADGEAVPVAAVETDDAAPAEDPAPAEDTAPADAGVTEH